MPDTQFTGRFDMAAKGLCPRLRAAVMSLPQGIKEQAQESVSAAGGRLRFTAATVCIT